MTMKAKTDIDALVERYYEADLSEQEEQTLVALLFGPYAEDKRYDEHRAVLSFTIVGQRYTREQKANAKSRTFSLVGYRPVLSAVASIAACVVLVMSFGWFRSDDDDSYFMVRHGQVCYSSSDLAEKEMKLALSSVLEDCPSIQDQLSNVFADFEE